MGLAHIVSRLSIAIWYALFSLFNHSPQLCYPREIDNLMLCAGRSCRDLSWRSAWYPPTRLAPTGFWARCLVSARVEEVRSTWRLVLWCGVTPAPGAVRNPGSRPRASPTQSQTLKLPIQAYKSDGKWPVPMNDSISSKGIQGSRERACQVQRSCKAPDLVYQYHV